MVSGNNISAESGEQPPLALERALVFALVTAAIAILGHDLVAGTQTPFMVVSLTTLIAFFSAQVMASIKLSTPVIFSALVGMQIALHIIATLSSPLATQHHFTTGEQTLGVASIMMISAHLGATIIGTIIVASLEGFAWRAVCNTARFAAHTVSRFIAELSKRVAIAVASSWANRHTHSIANLRTQVLKQRVRKRGPPPVCSI